MKQKNPRLFLYASALCVALIATLVPVRSVFADTVLYDSSGFIEGAQAFTQSFDITAAGTLTVTLSDVPWLDAVSNLGLFVTSANGVLAPTIGAGTETIQVQPGMVYAHWYGQASGPYGLGVYGLKVDFSPGVAPVPLPNSLIMILSGLGLLLGWQRPARIALRDASN